MRCIICNKEIEGGFIVERECVEALKAENEKLRAHIAELKTLEEKQDHLLTINGNGEIKKLETVILTCPKCGSTDITVDEIENVEVFCRICGYDFERKELKPTITTLEKLLWLIENCHLVDISNYLKVLTIQVENYKKAPFFYYGESKEYKTVNEAINAAYEWAKEQEK